MHVKTLRFYSTDMNDKISACRRVFVLEGIFTTTIFVSSNNGSLKGFAPLPQGRTAADEGNAEEVFP